MHPWFVLRLDRMFWSMRTIFDGGHKLLLPGDQPLAQNVYPEVIRK
jgi:hypothetical protein